MVGFVVPLALALFTSLVVFQIVRTYNRSVADVTAASQASGDLNVLIKTVIDAETGQRGFAITGNEVFLEPYTSSTASFGVALSGLRDALSDTQSQQTLNDIDALFERWQREGCGGRRRLAQAHPGRAQQRVARGQHRVYPGAGERAALRAGAKSAHKPCPR